MKGIEDGNGLPYITATLQYKTSSSSNQIASISAEGRDFTSNQNVLEEVFRLNSVCSISLAVQKFKLFPDSSRKVINQIISNILKSNLNKSRKFLSDLLIDLQGQVTEAISNSHYFQKWGRYYLPSLARAHQIQQCNNFKDPGVQNYGESMFNQIRDKSEETFLKIPPPQPQHGFNEIQYFFNKKNRIFRLLKSMIKKDFDNFIG